MRRRGGELSEEQSWMKISVDSDDFDDKKRSPPTRRKSTSCLCRCCVCLGAVPLVVGLALVAAYALLPCPIDPQPYSLPAPREWTGALAANDRLAKAEVVLEGRVAGPESLLLLGETMFTGLKDGRLIKILRGEIDSAIRFGPEHPDCDGSYGSEEKCGRPLGIKMNDLGETFAADAYRGLVKFHFPNGTFEVLVPAGQVVEGQPVRMINDLEFFEDEILFTDSSSKWTRKDHTYILLEAAGDGRLLSLDRGTGQVRVLMRGLQFANGLALSGDKKSVLVAETLLARVQRYHLAGPRVGTAELWADNLPGFPDNIRRAVSGGFWLAFAAARDPRRTSFLDRVQAMPRLRRLLASLVPAKHFESLRSLVNKPYGLVVKLNEAGEVVESLHDPSGKVVGAVSEVGDAGPVLFLGSYSAPAIAKVTL